MLGVSRCDRCSSSSDHRLAELGTKVEALAAAEIPTYRTWRAIAVGSLPAKPGTSSDPEREVWHRGAMRRQARLAEQERAAAIGRHRLARDRKAFEVQRQALAEERAAFMAEQAQLREDVVAGVRRDRATLLEEVGELERRRRAALAMLPPHLGARGPAAIVRAISSSRIVATPEERAELAKMRSRLQERGTTLDHVAVVAGVTRAMVSHYFAGRTRSRRVFAVVQRLAAGLHE